MTGRIAREKATQHETANKSVLKIDDITKIKTGFRITCHGGDRYLGARAVMVQFFNYDHIYHRSNNEESAINETTVPRPNNI